MSDFAESPTTDQLPDVASHRSNDAWAYDFFQALRHIEATHRQLPRIGHARLPAQESVRIQQSSELEFAPTSIDSIEDVNGRTEVTQRFFGLLGPNGPMPLHWTEHTRDRVRHDRDPATEEFLNIFTHRMATLFYRAWSQARGVVQHDRPDEDRFRDYLLSLTGGARTPDAQRQSQQELHQDGAAETRAHFVGRFAGIRRNAEGLAAVLQKVFSAPAKVLQFTPHMLRLDIADRTVLRSRSDSTRSLEPTNVLGRSTVLGTAVPDRASKITVILGPVDRATFDKLVPGGTNHSTLLRLIREYIGPALCCRVVLALATQSMSAACLGKDGQLGVSCWMGQRQNVDRAEDCHFDV